MFLTNMFFPNIFSQTQLKQVFLGLFWPLYPFWAFWTPPFFGLFVFQLFLAFWASSLFGLLDSTLFWATPFRP